MVPTAERAAAGNVREGGVAVVRSRCNQGTARNSDNAVGAQVISLQSSIGYAWGSIVFNGKLSCAVSGCAVAVRDADVDCDGSYNVRAAIRLG